MMNGKKNYVTKETPKGLKEGDFITLNDEKCEVVSTLGIAVVLFPDGEKRAIFSGYDKDHVLEVMKIALKEIEGEA